MFLLCFRCRVASRLEHFMNQFFILFGKFDYCHPLYSSAQKKSMYVSNNRTDDNVQKSENRALCMYPGCSSCGAVRCGILIWSQERWHVSYRDNGDVRLEQRGSKGGNSRFVKVNGRVLCDAR